VLVAFPMMTIIGRKNVKDLFYYLKSLLHLMIFNHNFTSATSREPGNNLENFLNSEAVISTSVTLIH
jgi:hypothetical protein